MRVATLLAAKGGDVATISQERSIEDAVSVLKQRGIGALVVTGPTAPLVGIISERDIVRSLALRGGATLAATVANLMSPEVTMCDPQTTVTELMALMTAQRIRHVPVVEGTHLVGMVSIGDVVKARLDELEHDKKELLDYVSSW